jgi:hypothetical protein
VSLFRPIAASGLTGAIPGLDWGGRPPLCGSLYQRACSYHLRLPHRRSGLPFISDAMPGTDFGSWSTSPALEPLAMQGASVLFVKAPAMPAGSGRGPSRHGHPRLPFRRRLWRVAWCVADPSRCCLVAAGAPSVQRRPGVRVFLPFVHVCLLRRASEGGLSLRH